MQTLVSIDPKKLSNHPLALAVFGERHADGFDDSLDAMGQIQPPVCNSAYQLISGHCRRRRAIMAGEKTIAVLIDDRYDDPLQAEMAVIHSNVQRTLSIEQRARMANEVARLGSLLHDQFTLSDAAEQADVSPITVWRLRKIDERIDALKEQGQEKEAEQLAKIVSDGNIRAAYECAISDKPDKAIHKVSTSGKIGKKKKAPAKEEDDETAGQDKMGFPVPKRLKGVFEGRKEFNRLIRVGQSIKKWAEEVSGDATLLLPRHEIIAMAKNLIETLHETAPHAVCPHCRGKGCQAVDETKVHCNGRGWLVKAEARGIPPDHWPARG